jgi:hypothetical protein
VSKSQRRDHKPKPLVIVGDEMDLCAICGDPVKPVYDRSLPVKTRTYWRHVRRR